MPHRLAAVDLAIVAAYLGGMVVVGVVVARRIRGFRDFFIAGGRMTTPLLVCTLVSTYYGLDVTFGSSETAFYEGLAAFFAYSAPFYLFYVLTAVLVAPRLKRLDALSLPEVMGNAYGPVAFVVPGAGVVVQRESAMLVTLPIALLAFAAGAAADRWRARR